MLHAYCQSGGLPPLDARRLRLRAPPGFLPVSRARASRSAYQSMHHLEADSEWSAAAVLGAMQKYAGIAPVTERSGKKCWVHWRLQFPKFLRQTFIEWAAETIPRSFWAGAYYRSQRDKGCSHQVALRALVFKWIRILYRCWQTRTPYDEATYLNELKRRGSPLLNSIMEADL